MTGLRFSLEVKASDPTPLDLHKAVIKAGKPKREELDWAIMVICPEIKPPMCNTILVINP